MNKITEAMFALLRFVFTGQNLSDKYKRFSEKEANALYSVSKKQDLSHIIAVAVEKGNLDMCDEAKKKFHKQKVAAFYRSSIRESEYRKLAELLQNENICYLPLKGIIIKELYPEEWMRTSSDIDILVHPEDVERVSLLLTEKLEYKKGVKGKHDIGFIKDIGVHIEVHFDLADYKESGRELFDDVWELVKKNEEDKCCLSMPEELFYTYHVWHMAKHIRNGGCGVRYFIDLWLLHKAGYGDTEKRAELLEEGGLTAFEAKAVKLAYIWMEGKKEDKISTIFERYAFTGGVYGNKEQYILSKNKNKIAYIFRRIFLDRYSLEISYPKLQKYPILIPYYTVKRWCRFFTKKRNRAIREELRMNLQMKAERKNEVSLLFRELGLK